MGAGCTWQISFRKGMTWMLLKKGCLKDRRSETTWKRLKENSERNKSRNRENFNKKGCKDRVYWMEKGRKIGKIQMEKANRRFHSTCRDSCIAKRWKRTGRDWKKCKSTKSKHTFEAITITDQVSINDQNQKLESIKPNQSIRTRNQQKNIQNN